jgi:hypothetical protein
MQRDLAPAQSSAVDALLVERCAIAVELVRIPHA